MYKIIRKSNTKAYFEVMIKADSNDGDYMKETQTYKPEEFEKKIAYYLYLLLADYKGNHQLEDFPSKYGNELPIPFAFDGYCHTLKQVKISYHDEANNISDVVFEINEENTEKVYEFLGI